MNNNLKVKLKLTADGSSLVGEVKLSENALNKLKKQTDKSKKSLKGFESETIKSDKALNRFTTTGKGVVGFMSSFKGLLATAGAGVLISQVVTTTAEFQKLNASLVTVTGSKEAADAAFDSIKSFAKTTPFQLTEVTDSFIKMQALGLDPSERAMRSYGDTASAMGKSLNQMVEAVADASTGEFERLKEFGIKSRSEGENVIFTFKGVETEIHKDAASIEGYLISLGELNFAGGMQRQMDTIGGQLSNLEDSWDRAFNAIGNSNNGIISETISGLSWLANEIEQVFLSTEQLRQLAQKAADKFNITDAERTERLKKTLAFAERKLAKLQEDAKKAENSGFASFNKLGSDLTLKINAAIERVKDLKEELGILEAPSKKEALIAARKQAMLDSIAVINDAKEKAFFDDIAREEQVAFQRSAALVDYNKQLNDQWNAEDDRSFAQEELQAKRELNQQINELTLSTNNFGEAWVRTGDKIIDAMASVGQVLEKNHQQELLYAADKKKIASLQDEYVTQNGEKSEKLTKKLAELEANRTKSSLKGSLTMLDASVGMYKKGSDAQRIAHQASLAIHAVEMGMNISKAISAATVAVAEQGKGDPYTAWARIAGMSVMMGGLLSQIGASFSGASGGSATTVAGYKEQTAGTLGGDGTSNAISASSQYLVDIQAGQYKELQRLNTSMTSLNDNITGLVKNLFYGGDLNNIGSNLVDYSSTKNNNLYQDIVDTVFFGSNTANTTDYGLNLSSFKLGDNVNVAGYQTTQYERKASWLSKLLGGKDKKWTDTQGVDVNSTTQEAFNRVFSNMRDSTLAVAQQLDINAQKQINDFTVSIGSISTAGKSAQELSDIISGKISAVSDTLASEIFGTYTKIYGKLNETAFETASRLAVDKVAVGEVLSQTAQQFAGDAVVVSQALIKLSGGLSALQDNVATYYDKFYSEDEKAQRNFEQLTQTLADVGQVLPATRDSYRQLVEGLDLATQAGQAQYTTLMKVSGAADKYFSNLEKAQQEAFDTQIALYQNLKTAISNTFDSITKSIVPDSMQYMQAQATLSTALSDAKNGTMPVLDNLKDSLSVLSRNNQNNYATFADYQRDQIATANMLDELNSYIDTGISVEERTFKELQTQTALLADVKNSQATQVGQAEQTNILKNPVAQALSINLQVEQLNANSKDGVTYKVATNAITGEQEIQQSNKRYIASIDSGLKGVFDGSHANGLTNVPFDGYVAQVHKDEMIAPAPVTQFLRSAGVQVGSNNSGMSESQFKALLKAIETGNNNNKQLLMSLVRESEKSSRVLKKWDATAQEVRVVT